MLRLSGKSDVGDDVTGKRELRILEPVNQTGGDRQCVRRRDSKPDSMLLAYKG